MTQRLAPVTTRHYLTRQADERFVATVRHANGQRYTTPAYVTAEMAAADAKCWDVFQTTTDATPALVATGEGPEPRGIRFESKTCGRCGGVGRKTEGSWAPNNKGICYQCNGACVVDTDNGYRARMAFIKMQDAELGTTWGELADGEVFKFEGKWHKKGDHWSLWLCPETKVHRHNGAVTRTIWRKIAAQYSGATLEY